MILPTLHAGTMMTAVQRRINGIPTGIGETAAITATAVTIATTEIGITVTIAADQNRAREIATIADRTAGAGITGIIVTPATIVTIAITGEGMRAMTGIVGPTTAATTGPATVEMTAREIAAMTAQETVVMIAQQTVVMIAQRTAVMIALRTVVMTAVKKAATVHHESSNCPRSHPLRSCLISILTLTDRSTPKAYWK